jgi:ectoine hydroxylase-related dioxygenase (phytanoyl-CoA dioxygenase family)
MPVSRGTGMSTAFAPLEFGDFHRHELPRRLAAGHGAIAARDDLQALGGLAFRTPNGESFTYRPRAGAVDVVAGDADAETVIEIAPELWCELAHDLESAPGLLYAGRVRCAKGDAMRFVRWEPALRAMYHGRPIFRPERADLRDRAGRPLDPARAFTLADDRPEMAHFLRTAGYLLARAVFAGDELRRLQDEADACAARARRGDKRSWWGKNAAGEEVLCRVTRCSEQSALFRGLARDPRIAALGALSHHTLVPREAYGDGVSVLIKNPAMTEGLSDLPWHRDCGMGGHAAMCPVLIFSIYLVPSRPETGELRMLPGSHEGSLGFFEATDPRAPRGVGLAADAGDVSLHYGDIMHAAPPPTGTGPFRTCVLLSFARPDAYNHRGESSYNDVLLSRDDGQVEHLAKVARRA